MVLVTTVTYTNVLATGNVAQFAEICKINTPLYSVSAGYFQKIMW